MKALGALVVLVAFAASCEGAPSSGTSDGGASAAFAGPDSAAIVALNERLKTAALAGTWDSWTAEYTADAVRMPPNAAALIGKAAADEFNRRSPRFSTFDITLTSVIGRADLATVSGRYKVTAPAGKDSADNATPAVNDAGKFMQILMKQADGSWKITRDIWNSDLPLPAPSTN